MSWDVVLGFSDCFWFLLCVGIKCLVLVNMCWNLVFGPVIIVCWDSLFDSSYYYVLGLSV